LYNKHTITKLRNIYTC